MGRRRPVRGPRRVPRGGRNLADRALPAFVKPTAAAGTDQTLGAHIIGPQATEPIHERAAWDEARGAVRTDTP